MAKRKDNIQFYSSLWFRLIDTVTGGDSVVLKCSNFKNAHATRLRFYKLRKLMRDDVISGSPDYEQTSKLADGILVTIPKEGESNDNHVTFLDRNLDKESILLEAGIAEVTDLEEQEKEHSRLFGEAPLFAYGKETTVKKKKKEEFSYEGLL